MNLAQTINSPRERAPSSAGHPESDYWDGVLFETPRETPDRLWRSYMRFVYARLLREWLPAGGEALSLKTDLFEEAITPHHLLPDLSRGIGIDISPEIARAARRRLVAEGHKPAIVVCDLRELPFREACLGSILSGSSLDHFREKTDIARGLAELARVMVPGGRLIVTFDNPHNPLVRLRNGLPFEWLRRVRLVPYYVGATYSRSDVLREFDAAGLRVMRLTTVVHAPRAPAIWLASLIERRGWRWLDARVARLLRAHESLGQLPTRYLTGYYLAVCAEKRADTEHEGGRIAKDCQRDRRVASSCVAAHRKVEHKC